MALLQFGDGNEAAVVEPDLAIIGNQLLPGEFAVPVTAPLKFPSIWDINKHKYIHYDHNTTSVMDRNIGEAIGTGAMFDPKTFASTVPTRNLHDLETLARKIRWPAWPQALEPIDKVKAERGAGLYQTHCVKCYPRHMDESAELRNSVRYMSLAGLAFTSTG